MSSEIQTSADMIKVKAEISPVDDTAKSELVVSQMPSAESSTEEQWQEFGERASEFINHMPSYVADFLQKYQQLLVTIGLILAALTGIKLMLAVLEAINDIPFLALALELIGLAYVIWFTYRYLLSAASRQQLSGEIKTFKEQVLGL